MNDEMSPPLRVVFTKGKPPLFLTWDRFDCEWVEVKEADVPVIVGPRLQWRRTDER